jgi:hypothetical protein
MVYHSVDFLCLIVFLRFNLISSIPLSLFVSRSLGKEEHGGGSLGKRSEQQSWHGCCVQIFSMETAGGSMVVLTISVCLS